MLRDPDVYKIMALFVPLRHAGADPKGGLGGIKPPYLPNINEYPPKPLLSFLGRNYEEEGEKKKKRRGGRRWEGR